MTTSLRIVAVLALIGGIISVLDILITLAQGNLKLDFGFIGIFVAYGLFKGLNAWRIVALVFTWLSLIGLPIAGVFIVFLFFVPPGDWEPIGPGVPWVGGMDPFLVFVPVIIFLVLLWAYNIWKYRVLVAPATKRYCGVPTRR